VLAGGADCETGDWPVRDKEASISSAVRFLERRKESFCSSGAEATEGSWRTALRF